MQLRWLKGVRAEHVLKFYALFHHAECLLGVISNITGIVFLQVHIECWSTCEATKNYQECDATHLDGLDT